MKTINDLKNLLFNDIYNSNKAKDKLNEAREKVKLYGDLLRLLDLRDLERILVNKIGIKLILSYLYDKDEVKVFNFETIIQRYAKEKSAIEKEKYLNELVSLINIIRSNYELEKEKLEIIKNQTLSQEEEIKSRRIISNFKFKQIIDDELQSFILERLKKDNIKMSDIIVILERVKIHNSEIAKSDKTRINTQELYALINIMEQGYEKIELPDHSDSTLDCICDNIVSALTNASKEAIKEVLDGFNYYDDEYLKYIYTKLMIYYQEEMYNTIEVLKDDKFYFDHEVVNLAKTEYYNSYVKYIVIRNYLDKIQEKSKNEIDTFDELESNEKNFDITGLYYSTNNEEDATKCYFISDLMDVREESLNRILSLINDFKKGKNITTKFLTNSDGCIEIKDDQIRIVLKSIGVNQFSVMGVFIKKADNDKKKYASIFKRPLAKVNDEYSREVEDYYTNYINEHARKGSR